MPTHDEVRDLFAVPATKFCFAWKMRRVGNRSALPIAVESPDVKRALDLVGPDLAAVPEMCAEVRERGIEHRELAVLGPKHDEVFAEVSQGPHLAASNLV